MNWMQALRARLRLLFSRSAESRMNEEIGFHIEMETERLVREEGLDPAEARRRALVAFGGVDRTREEMRDGRGLAWLSGLRLDFKLGARMLMKYPVLTTASVLALAIAVALAASAFEFMQHMATPRLPLPGGDRIVSLRNLDLQAAETEARSLHDFEEWRLELRSIEHLAAMTMIEYGIMTEAGRFVTVSGRRTTPSLFEVAGVEPLIGRVLRESDDRPGAEPVAVLGYDAWQRLFDGDVRAVGKTVRLGDEYATIVGVMPENFGFPVNDEIWVPLRERAVQYARREGPRIAMTGRLRPGASVEEAQAELDVLGQRAAAEFPATHQQLKPEVRRFGAGGEQMRMAALANIPFLLFLIVVSANVATLLFARTATRQGEIAMRSALGASRRRLVLQLAAEALVLTLIASLIGLVTAHYGMEWGMDLFWEVQQMAAPFWMSDNGISIRSVVYVLALAVLGALIIGAIPGLRATRRHLRQSLTQAGGGGNMRFGRVATGVIVMQVALCVAFIPYAILNGQSLLTEQTSSAFPAASYLTARISSDAPPAERAALFDEVRRRLEAEEGVLGATRVTQIPGFNHLAYGVEIEGSSAELYARTAAVDPDFFDAVGARIVDGRGFRAEDVQGSHPVVVVNEYWANELTEDHVTVGDRVRYPNADGTVSDWHEVVGVVSQMQRAIGPGSTVGLFHPLRPQELTSFVAYLRTDRDPESILPRVHGLITSVDPALTVSDLAPLDDVWRPVQRSQVFFTVALGVVGAIILLFAMIGIYALMSFTVARRTREIGVRAALGAEPRRIVLSIFSRAMAQIGAGVALGAIAISLTVASDPDGIRLVAAVAAAMIAVGLLGCVIPARRALRIQPTDALRAE